MHVFLNSPSTPVTHWLGIHFAPRQCHRFEYQTPIKATSLGLFEHHHAVRGRWAAQGNGSWNYWVKILMERSQSPCRCSQRLMLMFSKLHLGNSNIFIYLREKSWQSMKYMLFFSTALILVLEFHTVTPGRWRTTTAPRCWPWNSSHWTVGGWEPCSRAWWWWFTKVSYSDFLSQVLCYSREYIFGHLLLLFHIYKTLNFTGWTGCVLCCYRWWIHCLTASTE